MENLNNLTTESRNQRTMGLDMMTPFELAKTMNQEDKAVLVAVEKALPEIAKVIEMATQTLRNGGRLIYFGAGTSGRLGVLDAVECPPTFGTQPERVLGLIAGGSKAFVKAVEGAEDSQQLAVSELKKICLSEEDLLIGIAASGRTPYVLGGLSYAKQLGAQTAAIACNQGSLIGQQADVAIEVVTGPEVLTGSTRLKAGTAQKMVLNMISTGAMVGIGKVYQNLMVDLMTTNEKLVIRAENMVMMSTGCSREEAKEALEKAEGSVKLAIVKIILHIDIDQAKQQLEKADGYVRQAIKGGYDE